MVKIIHYCWFGGKRKPRLVKKCIKSWKKYFPDFTLKEWNESNFDVNCCEYVSEAYKLKKYAFVSDYCRFYVLKKYGGFYLDTDVLVLKNFILDVKLPFFAIEKSFNNEINPGLCCYLDKNDIISDQIIEQIRHEEFNTKTICTRVTDIFDKLGYRREDVNQVVAGYYIYSSVYFCPIDYTTYRDYTNDKTYAKHLYYASWARGKAKIKIDLLKIKAKILAYLRIW